MNSKSNPLIEPNVKGNILHINICNMDEFERRMENIKSLAQKLDEAIAELSNFDLKITFSDKLDS